MFCTKCGYQLKEESMFCPKCGTKTNTDVNQEQSSITQGGTSQLHMPGKTSAQRRNNKLPLKIMIPAAAIAVFVIAGIIFVPKNTVHNDTPLVTEAVTQTHNNSKNNNSNDDSGKKDISEGVTVKQVTEPPAREETYTGSSGNTFTVPPEGYARVLIDGTEAVVPAKYSSRNPTEANNYDKYLFISLDGNTSASGDNKYAGYSINTIVKNWSTGASLYLDEMCNDMNSIFVNGYHEERLQYIGSTIYSISTKSRKSSFEESELTVIELNGSELKFYFNLKICPEEGTHTFEGVGHVILDSESGGSSSSGGSAGNSYDNSFVMPTQGVGGTEKCAVCKGTGTCSVCDGSGQTWGWKQKVKCTNCYGTGTCPFCNNGYVTY